jgi:hypothetical protein
MEDIPASTTSIVKKLELSEFRDYRLKIKEVFGIFLLSMNHTRYTCSVNITRVSSSSLSK